MLALTRYGICHLSLLSVELVVILFTKTFSFESHKADCECTFLQFIQWFQQIFISTFG